MRCLRCDAVSKNYGGVKALDEFTFRFPEHGIVGIIGANGAGKTTLLDVITGFVRADRGSCFVGELEITRRAPHRIARLGIARTFQELRLIVRHADRMRLNSKFDYPSLVAIRAGARLLPAFNETISICLALELRRMSEHQSSLRVILEESRTIVLRGQPCSDGIRFRRDRVDAGYAVFVEHQRPIDE